MWDSGGGVWWGDVGREVGVCRVVGRGCVGEGGGDGRSWLWKGGRGVLVVGVVVGRVVEGMGLVGGGVVEGKYVWRRGEGGGWGWWRGVGRGRGRGRGKGKGRVMCEV